MLNIFLDFIRIRTRIRTRTRKRVRYHNYMISCHISLLHFVQHEVDCTSLHFVLHEVEQVNVKKKIWFYGKFIKLLISRKYPCADASVGTSINFSSAFSTFSTELSL